MNGWQGHLSDQLHLDGSGAFLDFSRGGNSGISALDDADACPDKPARHEMVREL